MAFRRLSLVIISEGFTSSFTSSTTCIPLSKAILRFWDDTAEDDEQYGILIPITSVRQAIVFAVYIPWQAPADGQEFSSSASRCSSVISPFLNLPTASNEPVTIVNLFSPLHIPSSIGPAVTIIAGILSLKAPISIPGVILSQLESKIIPSS